MGLAVHHYWNWHWAALLSILLWPREGRTQLSCLTGEVTAQLPSCARIIQAMEFGAGGGQSPCPLPTTTSTSFSVSWKTCIHPVPQLVPT